MSNPDRSDARIRLSLRSAGIDDDVRINTESVPHGQVTTVGPTGRRWSEQRAADIAGILRRLTGTQVRVRVGANPIVVIRDGA